MRRRDFLKAGLGAAVAGTLALSRPAIGATVADGLELGEHGPLYQAGPDSTLDLTDEVTLEAWIRADPMPMAGGRILDKSVPGTNSGYLLDTWPGNSLRLITQNGACRADAHLAADHWTHVAGVYSASRKIMALYLDGREVGRTTDGDFPPLSVTRVPLMVGADPDGNSRFQGRILRAAVYRRALTADEVAQRAANAAAISGAVAEWGFGVSERRLIRPTVGSLPLQLRGGDVEIVGEATAPAEPLALWYRRPAQEWLEALPIGNGRLGAMVFGGVETERLQLNEGTVWAGGPYTPANPEGLAALPEIRRLVFADQWNEAQKLVDAHFMGIPAPELPYQAVGNLMIHSDAPESVSGYRRMLDLNTAITHVEYAADGVHFTREVFASVPDQVIVIRMTADRPGKIAFSALYNSPQRTTTVAVGSDTLALNGISGDGQGIHGTVRFQAFLRAVPEGGQVQVAADHLEVTGANAVTLLLSIGTSYRNYQDVGGDPAAVARGHLAEASHKPFEQIRRDHMADYQKLFHRVSIDLGTTEAMKQPTDARVAAFGTGHDPQLAALHFQYGRYLLISCSRPGGQPATLQGLWNDSLSPPWGSKYTVNINTEMNYWPTAPANLVECYDPLFAMLGELSDAGQNTARVQYGAGGWVTHHNTDGWRGTAPVDFAEPGMWPTGGAWLCKSFWDHYQFTGDRDALKVHYPIMKGAAQFFLDTLVEEPTRHWLVTNPSVSPEVPHHAAINACICAGPTLDMQLLRDLFDACAETSELFGIDAEFRNQVRAARARLAPMQIGHLGQLQEWLEDWDATADIHNRHVSHLYGLFPSNQITRRGTPDLFAAARKSLEMRGDEATGWSLAWKINLWARFEDGEHAYKLVQMLLTPDRTAPNLFDLHPPFQIDGNFGAVSGICEMLLQSHAGELHFLPALPAAWADGHVRGLRARGGFLVDLDWQNGKVRGSVVHSTLGGTCRIRTLAPLQGHGVSATAADPEVFEFPTRKGGVYRLTAATTEG